MMAFCDSGRIRTLNRQSRNLIFYPVELRSQYFANILLILGNKTNEPGFTRQMKKLSFLIAFALQIGLMAQQKPIGSWTDHLPYQSGTSVASNGAQIFCGTRTGVFIYNTLDNSITRWSKVNKLNDVVVDKLAFIPETNTLLIIYENANIDLIKNGRVINLPFIRSNTRVTNKQSNSVYVYKEFAYIAFGFGIVVMDTRKNEISDSYLFEENGTEIGINGVYIDSSKIYAGTENGLYEANSNSNLLDFNNWSLSSFKQGVNFKTLFGFNGKGYAVVEHNNADSVFLLDDRSRINQLSGIRLNLNSSNNNELTIIANNQYRLYDENLQILMQKNINAGNIQGAITLNSTLYVVNTFHPLLRFSSDLNSATRIRPNGPFERNVFDIDAQDGKVWAVSGGHDFSYNNTNRLTRMYTLHEGVWSNFIEFSTPSLQGVFDVVSVAINPNNPDQVYFGTWGNGLLEWNNQLPFRRYMETGTGLSVRPARTDFKWVGSAEIEFDEDDNVWISKPYTSSCLTVKKPNGSWVEYNFSQFITSEETAVKELLITDDGYKWIALPSLNEIIVFDDNGTIDNKSDDRSVLLGQEEGEGNLPGIRGITFEQDLDGAIWIGTSDGIAVYYSPENVFQSSERDAERVLIDDGENVEVLLENTQITDIEIDGSNQKWIATIGSGAFLLSEDGQEQIHNFTTANSPLVSDNILSIAIDDESGEVYFATGQGIVSYRGNAISGREDFNQIKVFPNPVRQDYQGPVAISGLMANTTVKITDINGTLVNEIESQGGQVLWYGTNFSGEEVSSGVYLLFVSAEDEEDQLKTQIGKLLYNR